MKKQRMIKNNDIYIDDYGMTKWHWLVRHKENFIMGDGVEIGNFTVIGCENGVEIRDNVKIGYHCVIMSESTVDNKKGKIIIKENAKIGANTVIMPGVNIGKNAVIGANSFVNKSVPDNQIWAGTPIRRIK